MKRLESPFEIAELVSRFLKGELSPDESEKLARWREESEVNRRLWRRLTDPDYLEDHLQYWRMQGGLSEYPEPWKTKIAGKANRRKVVFRTMRKYAAVVIIALAAGFFGWHFFSGLSRQYAINEHEADHRQVQIMPRGKVAQLVLGNGRVVDLTDSLGETLTEKDGTKVHNGSKMLYYTAAEENQGREVYNTLIVPRGGEYRVTLSDGTKVWLNAASSLRYPTQFGGKERRVFLSGEGYFEVAKDENHPFTVEAGHARIKVIGTKFNVSAYEDDGRERIALAEGAVLVGGGINGGGQVVLKPGYGAVLKQGEEGIRVHPVNMEAALAWKNGLFVFDGESLGSIMKKLSRWYNVDIKYEDGVDTLFHFTGRIQRYENITGILHLIELTGKVHLEVQRHEVVVRPKNKM